MRSVSIAFVAALLFLACDLHADDKTDGGDAAGTCGSATCTSTQICLYRECSAAEKCRPSATCAAGETPADCGGKPGCLVAQCAAKIQGCRDMPASCGNDVTCACGSICGSAAQCKQVDGRNALCAGS